MKSEEIHLERRMIHYDWEEKNNRSSITILALDLFCNFRLSADLDGILFVEEQR
jgi:hypothetical protein